MRVERKVIERKDQLLVAIPAAVRDHLGVVGRATVYWHTTKKGAAMLTTSGRARAGRMRIYADCASCAKYRAELQRLRAGVRGAQAGDYSAAFAQGVQQGIKVVPIWRHELEQLRGDVHELRGLLASLVIALPRRRGPRRRTDVIPAPVLSPPSSPNPGGADTSGAKPPGVPLSAE